MPKKMKGDIIISRNNLEIIAVASPDNNMTISKMLNKKLVVRYGKKEEASSPLQKKVTRNLAS